MAEPEEIIVQMQEYFKSLSNGKRVVITAGPTFEQIDPVRFIGNRSTGKMGYAIAEVMANKGYSVSLISGPSTIEVPEGIAEFISVESAAEMFNAAVGLSHEADICILAAAVADYTPTQVAEEKSKEIRRGLVH